MEDKPAIKYCLYARKSSEQDERQAMSIDSQIKEMEALAARDGLIVIETRQESHSSKVSGSRPVFNQLIEDIRVGKFNGIITWAPDRLSRNAGDLGMLVDLMDQNKLLEIRTHGQRFTNSPNEKFLLMILCSQAKLENDNRGINIKRGIRNRCDMGWRPCPSPIGYQNRMVDGVKDIIVDPDRGPYVQELFKRSALGVSGRTLKAWLDKSDFTTRTGGRISLSQVYILLRSSFYYGEFEYPQGSGIWYNGAHEPLISKELFDKVQKQLIVPPKSKWGANYFTFRGLVRCADCGTQILGEVKFKATKAGGKNRHVYYHCSRKVDYYCIQPYIREADLTDQIILVIKRLDYDELTIGPKLRYKLNEYTLMTNEMTDQDRSEAEIFYAYTTYLLRLGDNKEKAEFLRALDLPLLLDHKKVVLAQVAVVS